MNKFRLRSYLELLLIGFKGYLNIETEREREVDPER